MTAVAPTTEGALEKAPLELEDEIAALRVEIASHSVPWWRRAGIVGALTALISSMAPAVAAINGHYQVQKEIELKEAEQKHEIALSTQKLDEEIRSRYLDRMRDETERQRTLRFLAMTANDTNVKAWALAEQQVVEDDVKTVQTKLDDTSKRLDDVNAAATDAAKKRQPDVGALQRKAADLAAQKAALEARLRAPVAVAPSPIGQAAKTVSDLWSSDPASFCRLSCRLKFPSESDDATTYATSPAAQKCIDKCSP